MGYYHVATATERQPRSGEQTTDTGQWITPYNGQWTDAEAALCGFLPITETTPPTPGPGETLEAVVALVDGLPVRQWTVSAAQSDPRADLIAQVEQATTVAKLRAAVLAAIDAGAL